jgi:GWxTD domain-containing protein
MKKEIITFVAMLWLSFTAAADNSGRLNGRGEFKVDMDIACFFGDTVQSYVEMYYGFRENMLTYRHDSTAFTGAGLFLWEVKNDSIIVTRKRWSVPHTIDAAERLQKSQTLLGIESIGLPPGTYSSHLYWVDQNDSTRADSASLVFTVQKNPVDKEYFSDVELCTSIQNSENKQSMFYKNTLEVIPNPGRLYGSGLPILYYYATVYNLHASGVSGNVIVRADVLDVAGNVIVTKEKSKPRMYNSSVEIGTMNLSAVKTGTYIFRISLLDTVNTLLAMTDKRFFIFKIGSVPDSTVQGLTAEIISSKYALMSAEDLDRLFTQARYVASTMERDQYTALTDVKAKQKFLYGFWRRRDAIPATPVNETEQQYYQRIDRAMRNSHLDLRRGGKATVDVF